METAQQFFKDWSSAIQAISVVVLLFITWWYARKTNKMALLMAKEYGLKTQPSLNLDAIVNRNFGMEKDRRVSVQLEFNLENVGIVPVQFRVSELVLNNLSVRHEPPEPILIFPQQRMLYTSGVVKFDDSLNNEADGLIGYIKVEAWAVGIPEKKHIRYRKFRLAPRIRAIIVEDKYEVVDTNKKAGGSPRPPIDP